MPTEKAGPPPTEKVGSPRAENARPPRPEKGSRAEPGGPDRTEQVDPARTAKVGPPRRPGPPPRRRYDPADDEPTEVSGRGGFDGLDGLDGIDGIDAVSPSGPPDDPIDPDDGATASAAEPPAPRGRGRRIGMLVGYTVLALVSLLVFSGTGYAWVTYQHFNASLDKSHVLDNGEPKSTNGDTNILIMGLDTRLDENGNPLPQNIYNELHAGDNSDGGENANVLMLLHVPGDGSRATSISIPRDDYVDIPGCPDKQCKGKIKQAYGLAFAAEATALVGQTGMSASQKVQEERDAGRKEEINTVEQFLGGVPIDHFVEVTLIAFFLIAQQVQPITVCVNEDTVDSYSGANFKKGYNQINASQAVAFVRQRRDYVHPQINFTDLDRERRQQAFIASLAYQLKQAGTFDSPTKLEGILQVAQQNIAIDDGLDLLSFAQQASNLTSGNITFYTLPIQSYGTDQAGEDVNIVDVPLIQSTVHSLLYGNGSTSGSAAPSTTTAAPTTTQSATAVVNVENASGESNMAAKLEAALAHNGYTQGTASTSATHRTSSIIEYGAGASTAASQLASTLDVSTVESSSAVASGTIKVILGTEFRLPSSLSGSTSGGAATTSVPPASAVSATSGGVAGPPPTALSALSGGGIPCVK